MEHPSPDISAAWREHRRHLLDIAFRMLGNLAEAEDVVQEAFSRLVVADVDAIDDVGGWLVVVTTRLVPRSAPQPAPPQRAARPVDR